MKLFAFTSVMMFIIVIISIIIAIIGNFTIGAERIVYYIGCVAIGAFSSRCAHRIIDKITYKDE